MTDMTQSRKFSISAFNEHSLFLLTKNQVLCKTNIVTDTLTDVLKSVAKTET